MMSLDVRIERLIDATPEAAFDAWVGPEARLQWYADHAGGHVEASHELRVGGEWHVAFGPSAHRLYREDGVYKEVDPPRRLVYTCVFSTPDGDSFETLVTVTFEAIGDKTLLTLVDAGFRDERTRRAHESGWPSFLDRYERVVAARA